MKKLVYLLILFPIIVIGQTNSENWVKTTVYKDTTHVSLSNPTINQASQNVTYYDGLGRPIQQVASKQSGSGNNIVTPIEYDAFGRQPKDYLPYKVEATDLNYVPTALNDILDFPQYQGQSPFSEKLFEASPLNRFFEQAAPGKDWALGNNHTIRLDYQTNEIQEVKLYTVTSTWNVATEVYDITLIDDGFYKPNQLYKTITKNENWVSGDDNTTQEFKDKEGKVVLKRTFNNSDAYDTYYIYDIYGNLTYVLPPKVTDPLDSHQVDDLCYQYKYDYRNRLVEKKLPGKQWEYIVYDKLDRVVMTGPSFNPFGGTQTGWMVTKYDSFNRVVYTAWKVQDFSPNARKVMQNSVNGTTLLNERVANNDVDNVTINYTNNVFPTTDLTLLTVNYYDNYAFPNAPSVPTSVLGQPVMSNVKGMPTASWVRILDDANEHTFEKSYTIYDQKSRAVFVTTDNYLAGATSIKTHYNFQGQILETETRHVRTSSGLPIITRETFDYTPQGRLLNHFHKVNNNAVELVAHNEYDELGKLISKNVGGQDATGATGLQKVDYTYNIRGWLKSINDIHELSQDTDPRDLFAFKINYNEVDNDVSHNVSALYNGNIAETFWKSNSDNIKRSYGYKYDNLNRLLDSYYQKLDVLTNSYNESMQYDKNGNITRLSRTGVLDSDAQTIHIDDLEYIYSSNSSNRLVQVNDYDANPNGFKDGINTGFDYEYDANGNMTHDLNKGIENITYNHLNLPTEISFVNGSIINYLYDATGRKVRKIVTDENLGTQETTDYMGGYQYLNGYLKFFPTAEGYVNATYCDICQENYQYQFSYVYNYVDHLGNIRVSYAQDPLTKGLKILEENHYYPFGLKHTNYNSGKKYIGLELEPVAVDYGKMKVKPVTGIDKLAYKYKFNGKELQDELGLNMYDYGARGYMPDIVRTPILDPMAEKFYSFSPYSFLNNNPLCFVDPTGMETDGWIKQVFNGTTTMTFDPNVNTVQEAKDAGYWNVDSVGTTGSVAAKDGSYSYSLNADGTVTDCNGSKATSSCFNSITTEGGTQITSNGLFKQFEKGPLATGAISQDNTIANIFIGNALFKGLGAAWGALTGSAATTTAEATTPALTTVGRWMSQAEYDTMATTGQMVEGAGGQTFVATGGPTSFTAAAKGSVYAEFQVPTNSLLQGGQANWFKAIGPNAGNAMQSALAKQGGQILPTIQNLSPVLQIK